MQSGKSDRTESSLLNSCKPMRGAILGTIAVILLILFLPFPTKIAEATEARFVSETGQPMPGFRIAERWECYGLWGKGRQVASTDSSGSVHFSARYGYGTIATRTLAHLFKLISVHSSYGAYVSLDCFIQGSSFRAVFPSPTFTRLEPFATSGQYMDTAGRYYFPQESNGGQVVSVSGDFSRATEVVKIMLAPTEANKTDAASPVMPAHPRESL